MLSLTVHTALQSKVSKKSPQEAPLKAKFLEAKLAFLERNKQSQPYKILSRICSGDPQHKKIIKWFQKHAREEIIKIFSGNEGSSMPEAWEVEVWLLLINLFFAPDELLEWHRVPTANHAKTLKQHAEALRQLAESSFLLPPIFLFFPDELAASVIEDLPPLQGIISKEEQAKNSLRIDSQITSAPETLNHWFLFYQGSDRSTQAVLQNMANYLEQKALRNKIDARPNTGDVKARIFAKDLLKYFQDTFGNFSYGVIAECTNLKFGTTRILPQEVRDLYKSLGRYPRKALLKKKKK